MSGHPKREVAAWRPDPKTPGNARYFPDRQVAALKPKWRSDSTERVLCNRFAIARRDAARTTTIRVQQAREESPMPKYPASVVELLAVEHPVSLGPGAPAESLRAQIKSACATVPPAGAAGLWLRFDFLDESHAISQDDEGNPDRDFWHAIMHRREPDPGNSKYWWRRAGKHPVLTQLRDRAPDVGYTFTSPEAFVDFCAKVRDSGSAEEETAKRVQALEWDLLFAWCFDTSGERPG
jgi:hypothetical protein